jgi:hypothetical protein
MTRPIRLQLSRRKGFNLQEHSRAVNGLEAVRVARPGKWGNPFTVAEAGSPTVAVMAFQNLLAPKPPNVVALYMSEADIVHHLRGKNLACWCALDAPCHADVLLEIANRPTCERVG